MSTEGSGATRAGGEGIHNEDAFVVEEGLGLYLVCDGASGAPAGEVASRVAADALEEFVERAEDALDPRREPVARVIVERAMSYALRAVAEASRDDDELAGLTTTMTMLLAHGRLGVLGHRGDSRAYLLRRGRAHLLTRDHELTQDIEDPADDDDFDVFAVDLHPGDTVVLCTDGAERVVQDPSIVRPAADLTPRVLASRIASLAHRETPSDDATVVVVRVRGDKEPGWLELSIPPRDTLFGHRLVPA